MDKRRFRVIAISLLLRAYSRWSQNTLSWSLRSLSQSKGHWREAVVRLMHLKEMYLYLLMAELTCLFGFDTYAINKQLYIAWSAPKWIRGIGYDFDNEGIRSWVAVLVVWFVAPLVLQVVILICIMGIPLMVIKRIIPNWHPRSNGYCWNNPCRVHDP